MREKVTEGRALSSNNSRIGLESTAVVMKAQWLCLILFVRKNCVNLK